MENKRSKGVTFWAWIFIITSLWGIWAGVTQPNEQIKLFGIVLFIFSVLSDIAFLFLGILLLELKEVARKGAIFLCLVSVFILPFYLLALSKHIYPNGILSNYEATQKKIIIERFKPEYQKEALENFSKRQESMKKVFPYLISFIIVFPVCMELVPIYFFTRPKVKEQFKVAQ